MDSEGRVSGQCTPCLLKRRRPSPEFVAQRMGTRRFKLRRVSRASPRTDGCDDFGCRGDASAQKSEFHPDSTRGKKRAAL